MRYGVALTAIRRELPIPSNLKKSGFKSGNRGEMAELRDPPSYDRAEIERRKFQSHITEFGV